MTRHKVSELEGALLDAAVATCEGHGFDIGQEDKATGPAFCWVRRSAHYITELYPPSAAFQPSSEWAHGGPIIERERIWLTGPDLKGYQLIGGDGQANPRSDWTACHYAAEVDGPDGEEAYECFAEKDGPTALTAAMRAYVASKFGEEVDLP